LGSFDLQADTIILKEWLVTQELEWHQTKTEMIQSAPPEVDAVTDMPLKVKVSCASGCDLRRNVLRIIGRDSSVAKELALTSFDEETYETGEFTINAPIEPGQYSWAAVFPAQGREGVLHEESSTPFSFTVKPHRTSMAVWDVPSPIVFNDKFKIKVGVKCSAGCSLMGKMIAVYGPKGKKVATAALGGAPWPGTGALYWAEVELEAPGVEGYYRWRVKFRKPDLELPHEGASYHFAFTTATPPEHVVTVEVMDKRAKTALKNALVSLRSSGAPYKGHTDDGGVARVRVPKGQYTLCVSKGSDYEAFRTMIEIADDATIKAELSLARAPMSVF
jgi:hypothetical protein